MVTVSSVMSSLVATAIWAAAVFIIIRVYRIHQKLYSAVEGSVDSSQQLMARSTDVGVANETFRILQLHIEQMKHLMMAAGFMTIIIVVMLAPLWVVLFIAPTLIIGIYAGVYVILAFMGAYVTFLPYRTIRRLQDILDKALWREFSERSSSKGEHERG